MGVLVTSLHCNVDHPKFHTLQSMVSHCQIIHIFPPNQKKLPNQSLQKTTLVMKSLWQKMMLIYVLLGMWSAAILGLPKMFIFSLCWNIIMSILISFFGGIPIQILFWSCNTHQIKRSTHHIHFQWYIESFFYTM